MKNHQWILISLFLLESIVTVLAAGEATLYRDEWGVPHIWGTSHGASHWLRA